MKQLVHVCDVLYMVETGKKFLLETGGRPDDYLWPVLNKLRLKLTDCAKTLTKV